MPARIEGLLTFWFGLSRSDPAAVPERNEIWFGSDPAFDDTVRREFGELHRQAVAGELSAWEQSPRGTLALILAIDQLSRNIYRGRPQAFAADREAQRLCLEGMRQEHDAVLTPMERGFFYMPLQHAERLDLQRRSVECYQSLLAGCAAPWRPHVQGMLDFAIEHCDIIERFGRFPHRNAILGRESTAEERRFMERGGPDYGQKAASDEPG